MQQDDPLSPYLFLICVHNLQINSDQANRKHNQWGVCSNRSTTDKIHSLSRRVNGDVRIWNGKTHGVFNHLLAKVHIICWGVIDRRIRSTLRESSNTRLAPVTASDRVFGKLQVASKNQIFIWNASCDAFQTFKGPVCTVKYFYMLNNVLLVVNGQSWLVPSLKSHI